MEKSNNKMAFLLPLIIGIAIMFLQSYLREYLSELTTKTFNPTFGLISFGLNYVFLFITGIIYYISLLKVNTKVEVYISIAISLIAFIALNRSYEAIGNRMGWGISTFLSVYLGILVCRLLFGKDKLK